MLHFYLGNIGDKPDYLPIEEVGNMLICGSTGAGKSVYIHELVNRIKISNPNVLMAFGDPKRIEFSKYKTSDFLFAPVNPNFLDTFDILNNELSKRIKDNIKDPNIIIFHDELNEDLVSDKVFKEKFLKFLNTCNDYGLYFIGAVQKPPKPISLLKHFKTICFMAQSNEKDSQLLIGDSSLTNLKGFGDCYILNNNILDNRYRKICKNNYIAK